MIEYCKLLNGSDNNRDDIDLFSSQNKRKSNNSRNGGKIVKGKSSIVIVIIAELMSIKLEIIGHQIRMSIRDKHGRRIRFVELK